MTDPYKRVADLEKDRETLKEYMRTRMREEDWHGVMDAAADLRELDVELKVRREQVAERSSSR